MLGDGEKMITAEKKLEQLFNDHYITLLNGKEALNLKRWILILDQATEKEFQNLF